MTTPDFPLRLIFPSLSTVTPGDFSNTSSAFNPPLVGDASTFTTVLSILFSINGRLPTTVTWLSEASADTREISFSTTDKCEEFISNDLLQLVKPTCVTD